MSRAGIAVLVAMTAVLVGCGGGGGSSANRYGKAPACPLLAQLAQTGQTVERANVSDPNSFDATLQAAVTQYVATATKLRGAVPKHLQADVQRMITAVRRKQFADAVSARMNIDDYAQAHCKTST